MTLPRNELMTLIEEGRRLARERAQARFVRSEARVSAIGLCQKRQVGRALGLVEDDIPELYSRAGYVHEQMLAADLREVEPDLMEQVEVPTVTGGTSHPDFYLPSRGWAIQQKAPSDASVLNGTAKLHNTEQVLLEWQSWRRAGYCIHNGQRIDGVPRRYFLVQTGRESYGLHAHVREVGWDPARAARLEQRLQDTQMHIDLGILPERTHLERPGFECWDWQTKAPRCPFARSCWGDRWSIRYLDDEQPKRESDEAILSRVLDADLWEA